MKVNLLWVGKSVGKHVLHGVDEYQKRIKRYHGFQILEIPHLKNIDKMDFATVKRKEAEQILRKVAPDDFVVLLDEKGKVFDSLQFAHYMQKFMLQSIKNVVFIIGGAYGFDDSVYQRANAKLALSAMTFSHQLIRVVFLEQLYRANTIIKNEPYHNI